MLISKPFFEFHLINAAALNKTPQGSLWLDVQTARFRDVALVCGENFCLSAQKSDKVCRYQPVSGICLPLWHSGVEADSLRNAQQTLTPHLLRFSRETGRCASINERCAKKH